MNASTTHLMAIAEQLHAQDVWSAISCEGPTLTSTSTIPWETPASGARFICSLKPSQSFRSYLHRSHPHIMPGSDGLQL